MKPPGAAPIHPSAFIIHPLFAPLSPQTPSHPDPAPRLAPTRPTPLKSNFLSDEREPPGSRFFTHPNNSYSANDPRSNPCLPATMPTGDM